MTFFCSSYPQNTLLKFGQHVIWHFTYTKSFLHTSAHTSTCIKSGKYVSALYVSTLKLCSLQYQQTLFSRKKKALHVCTYTFINNGSLHLFVNLHKVGIWCNTVVHSRNYCCHGNTKIRSLCVVDICVTANNVINIDSIAKEAQQSVLHSVVLYTSPNNMKHT